MNGSDSDGGVDGPYGDHVFQPRSRPVRVHWYSERHELYQREDDKEETVKNRLNDYQEQTAPIIDFYESKGILHKMIGGDDPAELSNKIASVIKG